MGFLYLPPFRVQGISVAGEQTAVQVPELDIAFDIGLCPRPVLAAPWVALSHGHMDHVAGLPYYFSQRMFQKMPVGRCVCHAETAPALQGMMDGWADLERQRTPHEIIPLEPDTSVVIKPNMHLLGIEASHTVPAMSYVVIEHRSKLRPEFQDVPQDQLRDLRAGGTDITYTREMPLVAYTGDTEMGPHLVRPEFVDAQLVITECTFFDPEHRTRSRVGKHLHVDDIVTLLENWTAAHVVLVHASRRTNLQEAREILSNRVSPEHLPRLHFLMDHHANRARYEQQSSEVEHVPPAC